MTQSPTRRHVVAGMSAGAVLVGWARLGAAFQVVPLDAQGAEAIAATCGGSRDDHRRLVAAVIEDNAKEPADTRLSISALQDLLTRASCPTCGCAILAADAALPAD